MEYKDYYKVLGVNKNATKDEIKKAYRKLARELHPDINPGSKEAHTRFAEVNEANEVLSDDGKRRKYDALGADWQRYQSAGQPGDFDWSQYASGGGAQTFEEGDLNDLFGGGVFSDFFNSLFGMGTGRRGGGGGRARTVAMKGPDYQAELPLDLEEVYRTCVKTLSLNGQSLRITLEPGLRDNQTIKLKGKGGPGANGGAPGDLYITLRINLHPVYRREGDDLFMDAPVDVTTAVLGGELVVNTLSGVLKLKIKPETENGTTFRLKGRGFPVYGKKGEHGDLYVRLVLQTPKGLSAREKELMQELARQRGEK